MSHSCQNVDRAPRQCIILTYGLIPEARCDIMPLHPTLEMVQKDCWDSKVPLGFCVTYFSQYYDKIAWWVQLKRRVCFVSWFERAPSIMTEKVWLSSRQLEHVTVMPHSESGGAASHLAFCFPPAQRMVPSTLRVGLPTSVIPHKKDPQRQTPRIASPRGF